MRTLISLALLILICNPAYPQQSSTAPQPQSAAAAHRKVGLVLEGGSALGLAHIGVLRWLEEHHVPVSYVAGTSMGGLVGGVYSTGLSADELQKLIEGIPWDEVLQGYTPYTELSFRRKEDAFEYPNQLEFGLKKGLRFPEGFNAGQQVLSILDRIALPYSELKDFNELPTPFACVATDLVHSEKLVFRQGSLALALRSTMSLPGLFTPIRWGNHILVDGGLLDNLPVDVAKDMGADLTLAIHLESAKLDPDATLSSFGVLSNATSVSIAANELRSIEKADILISVPLEKFGSLDFKRSADIIKAGYDAAQAKAAILNTLSVDEATWQAYLAERAARRRTAPKPEFVQVEGSTPEVTDALKSELQKDRGKPVDANSLEHVFTEMIGQGRLASITYQMVSKEEKQGLLVTATEKPYLPPIVQPLILLDGANFAGVNFSLGARVTFPDFGSYRTELRTDLMIGTEYRFASSITGHSRPKASGSSRRIFLPTISSIRFISTTNSWPSIESHPSVEAWMWVTSLGAWHNCRWGTRPSTRNSCRRLAMRRCCHMCQGVLAQPRCASF